MNRLALAGLVAAGLAAGAVAQQASPPRGARLADLSWVQAEPLLDASAVVVIPLGAGAKEHGPHLKLNNDQRMANYLAARVVEAEPVAIAPTLNYHYYPSFLEYPGSTSLTLGTAVAMTLDIVRSLAQYGPRRFYVLNTGISTLRPLQEASNVIAREGVLLQFTDLEAKLAPAVKRVQQQIGGTHADEIETSIMLYIDPASVDMTKAEKEYNPSPTPGPFTRVRGVPGIYSKSGVFGDPTLATVEKGRELVDALVLGIIDDIRRLRSAPLPVAVVAPGPGARPPAGPPPPGPPRPPGDCTPGDLRAIRNIATAFTTHWANKDAMMLASLWARDGDIRHPDGTIERGPIVIRENRTVLFQQRAYQGTKHPVTLYDVRCVGYDAAVADGKWELRGVDSGKAMPSNYAGLCTLVLRRTGPESAWSIEAWRYTIDTPSGPPPPTVLKKPGWPG